MNPPRITTRAEWDATHGTGTLDPGPEPRVIIHHAYRPALSPDATVEQEVAAIQGIERHHIKPVSQGGLGAVGIAYNFLAAPSGRIYEGRGWKYRGAHAGPVNGDSIGICLLIDGTVDEPTPAMIQAVRALIAHGVELGEVATDYGVSGHRDHMARECPGDKVYARLQEFRHDAVFVIPADLEEPELEMVDSTWEPLALPDIERVAALRSPARAMVAATAEPDEPLRDWLCRITDWVTDEQALTGRLPWWLPPSLARRALRHVFGCAA